MNTEPDRPCRKCERQLIFATNQKSGSVVPMDLRATIYVVFRDAEGNRVARTFADLAAAGYRLTRELPDRSTETIEAEGAHVSHFATCPVANEFSRGPHSRRK